MIIETKSALELINKYFQISNMKTKKLDLEIDTD
jgi:hypothetical protein